MLPLLVTAGYVGTAIQGGKLILKGTQELTGIPVSDVVEGFVNTAVGDVRHTVAGSIIPIVSGGIGIMAGSEMKDRIVTAFTGASVSRTPATTVGAVAAKIETAGREAAVAVQRAEYVAGRTTSATERNKARAGRRYATLAQVFSNRAQDPKNSANAERLADLALSTAGVAKRPRIDARDVYASDAYTDHQKSVIGKVVDDINRDQEPNFEALADLMMSSDSMETAGHDHGHGHACACSKTADKTKHCNACKTKAIDTAGDDDDDDYGYDDDNEPYLAPRIYVDPPASCGTCPVPPRR